MDDNHEYHYTDDTPFDYKPWGFGQPDSPGIENCVELVIDGCLTLKTKTFNNVKCDMEMLTFVCKKGMSV